jgi:hypothetical protein
VKSRELAPPPLIRYRPAFQSRRTVLGASWGSAARIRATLALDSRTRRAQFLVGVCGSPEIKVVVDSSSTPTILGMNSSHVPAFITITCRTGLIRFRCVITGDSSHPSWVFRRGRAAADKENQGAGKTMVCGCWIWRLRARLANRVCLFALLIRTVDQ